MQYAVGSFYSDDLLRGRVTRPRAFRCEHNYPIEVTTSESGGYHARCLACGAIGPERPNSRGARQALVGMGTRRAG